MPVIVTEGASETLARHEAPVLTALGLRAAAAADLCTSLARLLGPLVDVLIRLWLAEGFLVTDVIQHMLPGGHAVASNHLPLSASLLAGLAATGFGVFVQTICPVLLAAGLFTRFAALALLVQVLVLQFPGTRNSRPIRWRCSGGWLCSGRGRSRSTACSALAWVPQRCPLSALPAGGWQP
jgi:uncharacterized membrane protein YphA (DoxX/SURF4 family)